ncbi:hypothetical protein V8F33_010625 [Rhypophila sp. PSN 637]
MVVSRMLTAVLIGASFSITLSWLIKQLLNPNCHGKTGLQGDVFCLGVVVGVYGLVATTLTRIT